MIIPFPFLLLPLPPWFPLLPLPELSSDPFVLLGAEEEDEEVEEGVAELEEVEFEDFNVLALQVLFLVSVIDDEDEEVSFLIIKGNWCLLCLAGKELVLFLLDLEDHELPNLDGLTDCLLFERG